MEVKKIEDLFMANGNLNSAILRRDWFKNSLLNKEIMEKSRALDIFEGVDIGHRIWFIKDNMKVGSCEKCGKPRLVMPKGHGNHIFTMCCCNRSFNESSRARLAAHRADTKKRTLDDILAFTDKCRLDSNEFNSILAYVNSRPANYQFMICEKYKDFYSDLLCKTKDILPIDRDSIDIPQRLYIINNGLTKIPECPDCGKTLQFKNRFVGYAPCPCGELERRQETRAKSYLVRIPTLIDTNRYDILEYPHRLSDGMKIRCKKCDKETVVSMTCGRLNRMNQSWLLCKNCEILNGVSCSEKKIGEFIHSIIPLENMLENDRKVLGGKELDIYIPDRKLAFEYDGLYWHCDDGECNTKKHLVKTEGCEAKGIHLVHIFENEWKEKQDIVKSRIRNLLGSYDNVVYARSCEVKHVSSKESLEFQWKNHIQGGVNSKINLGLYHYGELVSLMTFSKPRFSKRYEWELVRFCNKLNYHVPGAASKLLKHFEREYQPKSIVSYADRRWSMNSESTLYHRLSFNLTSISSPNYWYVKGGELFNRIQFQKHKLAKQLTLFDESKSEWQNMQDNGYDRIFDCGNLVYAKLY